MAATKEKTVSVDSEKAMAGILALLIAEREERLHEQAQPRKTEVLLADAGLATGEISALTGKKPTAVSMAIQRGRQKHKKTTRKK